MKNLSKMFAGIFVLLILNACSTSNGKYSVISNKPLSLYTLTANNEIIAHKAEGISSRHVLIVIPSGRAPSIADAVNNVLIKYKGDYLTNVEITNKTFQLMWLYHYTSWVVSGDVIRVYK